MRLRAFEDDEIAVARFLVHQAERKIEAAGDEWESPQASRIYELPSGARAPRVR
jgi:hypothetical protein